MPEVIVRPGAQADIREAALWHESRRPGLGIERIEQNPLQFPEIESGVRRALLRRFPYAIYFVAADCPTVIAVLHQRRNPPMLKQRI